MVLTALILAAAPLVAVALIMVVQLAGEIHVIDSRLGDLARIGSVTGVRGPA